MSFIACVGIARSSSITAFICERKNRERKGTRQRRARGGQRASGRRKNRRLVSGWLLLRTARSRKGAHRGSIVRRALGVGDAVRDVRGRALRAHRGRARLPALQRARARVFVERVVPSSHRSADKKIVGHKYPLVTREGDGAPPTRSRSRSTLESARVDAAAFEGAFAGVRTGARERGARAKQCDARPPVGNREFGRGVTRDPGYHACAKQRLTSEAGSGQGRGI